MVDPSTVSVSENRVTADLIPSKTQPSSLELVATVLPNDIMRVHIIEKTPYSNRVRYEATEVLIPGIFLVFFVMYRIYQGAGIVNR